LLVMNVQNGDYIQDGVDLIFWRGIIDFILF
jgi:hypothetical protein